VVHASEYNYSLCSLAMMAPLLLSSHSSPSLSPQAYVKRLSSFTNWQRHHFFTLLLCTEILKWQCPTFSSQAQKDVQLLTSSSNGWLPPFPPLKPFPHLKKHIFKCPLPETLKLSYLKDNSIIFESPRLMFNFGQVSFLILYSIH